MTMPEKTAARRGFSGLQVALIVVLAVLVTVFVGWWVLRTYVFPQQLEPVALTQSEQIELGRKLRRIGMVTESAAEASVTSTAESAGAQPEAYSEADASREVFLTERELNGLIAGEPELASNLAVDLADDLVSFTLLLPVPPDFPVMPGRTVRVSGGAEVAFTAGKPVVAIRGVSLMGVPVPNAWLGDIKNVDLVSEFGDRGFWQAFAAGVEDIRVQDGKLRIQLRD